MKKILILTIILLLLYPCFAKQVHLNLAVPVSISNTELLNILLPAFEKESGIKVLIVNDDSHNLLYSQTLKNVDLLITQDPEGEKSFLDKNWGVNYKAIIRSEFVIVGPADDPVKIKKCQSVKEAFLKIYKLKPNFVSLADFSDAHAKEQSIWKILNLQPQGEWYKEAGKGTEKAIALADSLKAYILLDRPSWLCLKKTSSLQPLFARDPQLFIPYHIMALNPEVFPKTKIEEANKFIDFLNLPATQKLIWNYKIDRQNLFYPAVMQKIKGNG